MTLQTISQAIRNKIQQWESALFGKAPPTIPTISWPFIILIIAIAFIIPILSVRAGMMLNWPQILITLANSALTLLLTWWALHFGQLSFRTIGLTLKDSHKELAIGIGLFLVFVIVQILVLVVQGRALTPITIEPLQVLDAAGRAFFCAATEEIFYRGLVIIFLLSRLQRLDLVVLISSVVFALTHLHLGRSPLELLWLTGRGIFYALLYIWRGYNLTVPIVVHTLQNFLAILRY